MNSLTIEEEAIQTILSRAENGRNEYGEGLHESEKPLDEWITFVTEELVDAALYLMKARRKLREILAQQAEAPEKDEITIITETITQPGIKITKDVRFPRPGEVWASEFGATAKISEVNGKGRVRYFWTSASKEVQSWCDVPLDNFLSNYTYEGE